MKHTNKVFDRFYSRLAAEGWLKSAVFSLIVGLSASFISALVLWLVGVDVLFWISIVLLVAVTAVVMPAFYFLRFRPTTAEIAKRIDRLGLRERIITMTELENDDSYIAMRQREDAKAALAAVSSKSIKFRVSNGAIIAVSIVAAVALAMITVSGLSAAKILPSASEIANREDPILIQVEYDCGEGGYIEGDIAQIISIGEYTTAVVAIAYDDYVFVGWDDGTLEAERTDTPEQDKFKDYNNMKFTAIFAEIPESGDGDGEGDPGNQGDPNGDPNDPNGDPNGGENSDMSNPNDNPPKDDLGSGVGGGEVSDNDNVIDNEQHYSEVIEQYYNEAMELISQGQELSPMLKAILAMYYNILV